MVFTPLIEGDPGQYDFLVHALSVSYSRTPSLWRRFWSAMQMSFGFLRLAKKLETFQPDFIWVQAPPWPLPVVGWWLSKQYKARFILNLSDLHPRALRDLGKLKNDGLYRLLQSAESYFYRRADVIFGQSAEILTYVSRLSQQPEEGENPKWSKNSVHLYRNGIHPQHPNKKSAPTDHFRWVYVGSLGEAQDVRGFLDRISFAQLRQEFHIFGTGQQAEAIKEVAHQNKWVKLHAPILPEEVTLVLADFDAALIIQKQHIFGTVPSKIYEAMNAGLPILLLGAGESAKIIQESGSGDYVVPQDWSAIHQVMRAFPERKDLEQLGKNGQEFSHTHFSHEAQFQHFLRVTLAEQNQQKR